MLNATALAKECDKALQLAKADQFYGPQGNMSMGTGIIVSDLVQPVFLPDQNLYGTAKGPAIVLTHECDIDPNNVRPFNQYAIVGPLITLDSFVKQLGTTLSDEDKRSLALHAAAGNTTRMIYLPRHGDKNSPLYNGALFDLNYITSCGVSALTEASVVGSLTGYGIGVVDRALQNHLFRPKSDAPPHPM